MAGGNTPCLFKYYNMECKATKFNVLEKLSSIAAEIDSDVFIQDNKIEFSTNAAAENFIDFTKKNFYNQLKIIHDKDTNSINIIDTSRVRELYNFNESRELSTSIQAPIQPSRVEYVPDIFTPDNNFKEQIIALKRHRQRLLDSINQRISQIYGELKTSLINNKREELLKELEHYNMMKTNLTAELRGLNDMGFRNIVDNVDNTLTTLKNLVSLLTINDITRGKNFEKVPYDIVEKTLRLFENTEAFFERYGTIQSAGETQADQVFSQQEKGLAEKIRHQRNVFDELKRQFKNNEKELRIKLLQDDEILNKSKRMRAALKDEHSQEFKLQFGGAELEDISMISKMFYNIDMSLSFDGMLGKFAMAKFQQIQQDNANMFEMKKQEFRRLAKLAKEHGIDLENPDTFEFLYETDKYGDRTGRLISIFTPEFYSKIRDIVRGNKGGNFDSRFKQGQKKMKEIVEDLDVVNVFKLGFMHGKGQLTEKQKLFLSLIQKDPSYNMFKATDSYDQSYENNLKEQLGETDFNLLIDQFIDNTINYYIDKQGDGNSRIPYESTNSDNPLIILTNILKAKEMHSKGMSGANTLCVCQNTLRDGEKSVVVNDILNFSRVVFLPKQNSEYFNTEYKRNFIDDKSEAAEVKRKLYSFLNDNFKIVNTILDGSASLEFGHIKADLVDTVFNDILDGKVGSASKAIVGAIKDSFYKERYYSKTNDDVSKNYQNTARDRYNRYMTVFAQMDEEQMNEYNERTLNLDRTKYGTLDDFKNAIARAKSLEGYNENLYTNLNKMFDLAAAQKSRQQMYPVAKMLERQYNSYTTNSSATSAAERERANKRFADWIQRSIQKISRQGTNNPAEKSLTKIECLDMILSKLDSIPFAKRLFKGRLLKRMDDDQKEIFELYEKLKEQSSLKEDFKFSVFIDGSMVKFECKDGERYLVDRDGNTTLLETEEEKEIFDDALRQYYEEQMAKIGTDLTFQGVIEVIQHALLVKSLAGISMSGFNNRVQGMFAASEMDATGYYWTPGNLAAAEKYFFGSPFYRYMNRSGEHITQGIAPDFTKRMDIMSAISRRLNLFQDMKNQFDRTVEGTQSTSNVLEHNLDIWQLSVEIPEFKNQLTMVMAKMMDIEVMDNNGEMHPMFDIETGEFTCYDIVDGELVLKPEFEKYNKQWIEFSTLKEVDGKSEVSDVFTFAYDSKKMIAEVHGDYRAEAALGWSNSMIMSTLMTLKRWFPSEFMRAWGSGGESYVKDPKTGKMVLKKSSDLLHDRELQAGVYYDMVFKSKALWIIPIISGGTKLSKNPIKLVTGVVGGTFLAFHAIARRLRATDQQTHDDISAVKELADFCKATLFEMATFIPRIFFKRSYNVSEKSFTDAQYLDRYTESQLGNFRAAARMLATRIYVLVIGLAAKTLIAALLKGEDDDDDDKWGIISYDRLRRISFWLDNEANTLLLSTERSLHILDSTKDKFDIDGLPLISWFADIHKSITYLSDGDPEGWRYFQRALPTPKFPVISFRDLFEGKSFGESTRTLIESEGEFKQGQWLLDDLPKDIVTGGDHSRNKNLTKIRASLAKEYYELYKENKLPPKVKKEFEAVAKKDGVKDLNKISEKKFNSIIRKTSYIPYKSQKPYKNMSTKEFFDTVKNDIRTREGINNRPGHYYNRDRETGTIFDFLWGNNRDEFSEE